MVDRVAAAAPFSTPPRSTETTPSRPRDHSRPRSHSDTDSMSYVAVQPPASHIGRGHHPYHNSHYQPYHHPQQHSQNGPAMVDTMRQNGAWAHDPYTPRYFSSPEHHNQHYPPPPSSRQPAQQEQMRLPPASSLYSPPYNHHQGSPHLSHRPPPSALPTTSGREVPFALKTHYQYSDAYSTPSPVSAPSPHLSTPRLPPPPPTSAAVVNVEEEGRLRQHQQLLAKAAIQHTERKEPFQGLALNTRQLPPPPPHSLTSPASAGGSRWSPKADSRLKIADLLSGNSDDSAPMTNGNNPLPAPTGMPTPLSAPAVPSAASRPPSAKAFRQFAGASMSPFVSGLSKMPYQIRVRQQPAAARSCGFGERDRRVIDPPPIIQLSIDDPSLSPDEVSKAIRHPFSVIHVSIYDSTGQSDSSAMPEDYRQQRRLMGTLVASPFVGLDENGEEGCFFCFPDLSCRTPGQFRLKFSLVVIDPFGMKKGDKAPIRATAMSDVFTVYNAKDFPGMQASTPLTKRLKEQGCLISIKKGNEKPTKNDREETDEDEEEGGRRKRRKS